MSAGGALVGVLAASGLACVVVAVRAGPRPRRRTRAARALVRRDVGARTAVVGLSAFVVALAVSRVVPVTRPEGTAFAGAAGVLAALAVPVGAAAFGVRRQHRMLDELPAVAALLAWALSAGEPVADALIRVATRCDGELPACVREAIAGGSPVLAFEETAEICRPPVVARFLRGLAVALERGESPAYVLAVAGQARDSALRSIAERRTRSLRRAVVAGAASLAGALAFADVLGLRPVG